jgi:hypothetical protein
MCADKLDEASVLDAQTWREQWQTLLDIKKSDSEVQRIISSTA